MCLADHQNQSAPIAPHGAKERVPGLIGKSGLDPISPREHFGERIVTGLALNDRELLLAGAIPAALLALAACTSAPGADGRYATPSRGGWDSFRG